MKERHNQSQPTGKARLQLVKVRGVQEEFTPVHYSFRGETLHVVVGNVCPAAQLGQESLPLQGCKARFTHVETQLCRAQSERAARRLHVPLRRDEHAEVIPAGAVSRPLALGLCSIEHGA